MGWECISSVLHAENIVCYGLPWMPGWAIDIDTWHLLTVNLAQMLRCTQHMPIDTPIDCMPDSS